jgi:tetratricopeptide (TPR) repeat protein
MKASRLSTSFLCIISIFLPYFQSLAQEQETYHDLIRQGTEFRTKDNFPKAIEYYNKAIELEPKNPDGYTGLGYVYFRMKQYKDAINYCNKAIQLDPNSKKAYFAYFTLGESYHRIKEFNNALKSIKESIKLNPDYPLSHFGIAVVYWDMRKYKDAVESFHTAIRIEDDPKMKSRIIDALGTLYNNIGQHQNALVCAKKAVEFDPDSPKAHYNLGYAYLMVGNKSKATEQYSILKTMDEKQADELFQKIYK